MDYRDLPYDAEIEYLHSPVGSYIVIPSNFNCEEFTRYVSHFQFQSNIRQQRLFNSSKRAIYENGSGLLAAAQNSDWVSSGLNWSTECIVDVDTHKRKTFFYDKSMALLRTTTHSSVGNAYYELLLFTSTDQTQNANVKCWDFKAYIDDDLVLDLIPVRVGNIGYMYDRVSGQLFGNSGTGNFILGPDVAPGRYANEVAFLESWGNQYIDTGIKPSTDTKIELKCLYCKSGAGLTSYGSLIGADDRSNAYILNHSAVANFTYGLEFSNNFANPQTRLLTFDSTTSPQNMRVYDEGGSLVTTLTCIRGVFEVNQNLYLFATNRSGTPVYGSNRIMYCKIYDGDTLVRDYVPVEYNGIGYMYDKVSGLFFDNKGTGKLLFGSIAKACARSYTRRQLMLEKSRRFSLLYHWEASDGIVNNQWIDRRKGYAFTKQGSPAVTTVSGYEVMKTNYDNCFKVNLNSPALNMGSEWMIAIEFIIAVFPTDKATFILDFGALDNANHAFGLGVSTTKHVALNVKLTNNNNTFCPPVPPVEFVEYKMSTIIFGAEPYDSTHNNIYTIVGGIKTSASSHPTIANCRFNGNFSRSDGFFGRGFNGNFQSKSWKYIKSIKIYKDNKKR